jgi:hypothetical protein
MLKHRKTIIGILSMVLLVSAVILFGGCSSKSSPTKENYAKAINSYLENTQSYIDATFNENSDGTYTYTSSFQYDFYRKAFKPLVKSGYLTEKDGQNSHKLYTVTTKGMKGSDF